MRVKKSYNYKYTYKPRNERPARQHTASFFFYFVIVAVLVLTTIGYVILQTKIATAGFAVEKVQKQMVSLEKENNKLKLAIAESTNLRHVEERAKNEIGMVRPKDSKFVFIETDKIVASSEQGGQQPGGTTLIQLAQDFREWVRERAVVLAGALGE